MGDRLDRTCVAAINSPEQWIVGIAHGIGVPPDIFRADRTSHPLGDVCLSKNNLHCRFIASVVAYKSIPRIDRCQFADMTHLPCEPGKHKVTHTNALVYQAAVQVVHCWGTSTTPVREISMFPLKGNPTHQASAAGEWAPVGYIIGIL